MEERNNILIIKQSNDKELYASDIRNIGYLLNGIESLHKFNLLHSGIYDWKSLSIKEKKRIYNREYRIKINRIQKNSPIEIELCIKGLFISFELINIFLNDDEQFEILRSLLVDIPGFNIENNEREEELNKIKSSFLSCKKIIKSLGLVFTFN